MKKYIFLILTIVFFANLDRAKGQIEVHDNGKVSIGSTRPTTPYAQLYIYGSATNNPTLRIEHRNLDPWTGAVNANLNHPDQVSWGLAYQNGPTSFYVHASGWIYSSGMYLGSDSSLKTPKIKLNGALEKVNQIGGYNYRYKQVKITKGPDSGKITTPDTSLHMGVMADEIEKIAPYMVRTVANGKKAVDYIQLIPLLIEAVKEIDAENKKQADELSLLKARFNKLGESLDTTGGNFALRPKTNSNYYFLYQNNQTLLIQKRK